ncbi:MAG: hypothetical protein H6631_03570, partial [Anaerolineaceae bacterium]|nr:hypothetical protein [Anaerolineaceae bacterium]
MAKNIRINLLIRLRNLILALLLAITLLSGLLLAVSAAEQKPAVEPQAALQSGPPAVTSTLYYKSAQGLMPPAYVLDPDAPAELSISALSIPFLNPYTTQTVGSWPQVIAAADLTGDALNDLAIPTGFYFDPAHDEQLHILAQSGGALTLA